MTRNIALQEVSFLPQHLTGRSIALVGLMGAGKTSIGRRLAARLGLEFFDADAEIELAAGCSIPDIFARYGEAAFRDGERRVIRRLLAQGPIVLATGGGAFMDPATRAQIRENATSVWLRCSLAVLVRRVATRDNRPLLAKGQAADILAGLMQTRHKVYAEADLVVDCGDESLDHTLAEVIGALMDYSPPRQLSVPLGAAAYDLVIGPGLIARAGALLATRLAHRRVIVITDQTVAALHLDALLGGLAATGFVSETVIVPSGEASKSLDRYGQVIDAVLEAGVERNTGIIALGGGVVGDLAGFVAATVLRGLPFVQIPTTLLAQVDSSVGGKTGINTRQGKNLVGAFHQPRVVLADVSVLATLPRRELAAGYAEVVKAGLIGDEAFFDWCEANGAAVIGGDAVAQSEAIMRACAFKTRVVGDDEREEKINDGRALLNLGHTFGHALEAEYGYGGALLHGEGVAVGLGLAFRLSARLGYCAQGEADRVVAHLAAVGLPAELSNLNRQFSAAALIGHMRRDKKVQDGNLRFVLVRGIGLAFTSSDVEMPALIEMLRAEGCSA